MSSSRSSLIFEPGTIYCGDCKDVLAQFPEECVDLIYIDPPFHSGRSYEVLWGDVQEVRAFEDRWGDVQRYLDYMKPRVLQLYRVLKRTGSFYYHCDWHAGHYIKVMLDEIFGINQFLCEIAWKRTFAHSSANRPGINHDTILFYSKTGDFTWNKVYQPYSPDYVETFFVHSDPDGRRWQRVDLTGAGTGKGPSSKPWRSIDVAAKGRHWAYSHKELNRLDRDGKIHWPKKKGGMPRLKQYLDEMPGVPLQSVWSDIRPIHNLAQERLGYPTQKPLPLLERIIKASSNPGDVVLDGFCGCGTAIVAAEKLERRWIGVDFSPTACRVMAERTERDCGMVEHPITGKIDKNQKYYKLANMPMDEATLKQMPPFEFQNWAVLQLGKVLRSPAHVTRTFVNDKGIDGKIYLVDNVELIHKGKETLFGEKTPYIPVQVKQKAKVDRLDIDPFETALRRDRRSAGFFIGFDFTRGALNEIQRVRREGGLRIYPFRVYNLIRDEFVSDLPIWRELGE